VHIDEALSAGIAAFEELRFVEADRVARFLEASAEAIDSRSQELVTLASLETALAIRPRLTDLELPRTTDQLRQAAAAARFRTWRDPHVDPAAGIASMRAATPGVVVVLGPNNFPFAFNGVAGGDFAAAVATGHPVLVKANRGHPGTTRALAECVQDAAAMTGMPRAMVQLIYAWDHADGERTVSDPRVAATAFTGSRGGGLRLKAAADAAGRPIFLEMSSINPVVILPGATTAGDIADELATSMLSASGQFCTNPGLLLVPASARSFVDRLVRGLDGIGGATLLSATVATDLDAWVEGQRDLGAVPRWIEPVSRGTARYPATLLEVDALTFLRSPDLQREGFGNAALVVLYRDIDQLAECIRTLAGNLAGSIYSAPDGSDDGAYARVEPILRDRVGRLTNDKPPTGVAVVGSMVHGGPYPSTGHPGFTGVGIPASLARFTALQCYDNVPDHRLPPELRAANPLGLQRNIGGIWTDQPISG
jgi:NADP-dependent aldehyde dehydrogenase